MTTVNPSNIVPTASPSVYAGIASLSTMSQNAIIRPNNPPPGIAGFVMDIRLEDSVRLESDITDHFVEDNTTVQDQIALKPEEVTVHGLVGELAQTQAQSDAVTKQMLALPINAYLQPEYTVIQQDSINQANAQADAEDSAQTNTQSLDAYFNARSAITGNKQSQAFAYFYQLWKGRQLFTIDSPWGFFTSMAIRSLQATQDSTTRLITDFTLTFKKIRFANEVSITSGQISGRAALQSSVQTNNGRAGQDPVTPTSNQSWLKQLANSIDGTP